MVIIRMKGGLGNQMFQYALYCSLRARGTQVKMDEVNGFAEDPQRDPMLARVFSISYDKATQEEIVEMTDAYMHWWSRVRRKLFGRKTRAIDEEVNGNFDPRILELQEAYLEGYWQTEKYFEDPGVVKQLRDDFTLDPGKVLKDASAWETLKRIRQTESVSIHIRRGDYLAPGTVETFGGICTEEYYRKAVEYLLERFPDAVFYVFSNDKEWTTRHLTGDRFITVEYDEELDDEADLLLMSMCRHHILANSSFSWWAAWLNDAPEKTVIAPARWLNGRDIRDIYTDRMVRL